MGDDLDPYSLVAYDDGINIEHDSGGDNRPSIYTEGSNTVYRVSSLGSCIKQLVAIRAGVQPAAWPAKFRQKFADGHRGEDVIIASLEARGFTITRRQEEMNWQILPGVILRGHIDGVSQYLNERPRVFDAKTTSKRYGISDELKKKYDLSLSCYGHGLGIAQAMLGVGVKDVDTGEVVGEVECENIDVLPVSVTKIKARIAKIEALARQVAASGDRDVALRNLVCDTEQRYPCLIYWLHDDEKPVTVRTDADIDEIFDGIMAEYDAARQDESEAKALKADAMSRLIAHVGGRVSKATGEWELNWTGTGVKKELDKPALAKYLKAHGKTVEEFYGTKSVERSIDVKRVDA